MKIVYDKYEFDKRGNILFYTVYILVAAGLSEMFYRNLLFSVLLLPFVRKVKEYVISWIIDRRKRMLLAEFKDMLFMVSTSIGAGRSIKDAIHEAIPAIDNIYGNRSYLVPEMQDIYKRMSDGNEKDTDVLMDFALRTGLEDIIDFVNIYSTCKTTGASLIVALNKASSVIIDKMAIDKEIREITKRKESEGMLIFIMPAVIVTSLNLLAPDYIAPLYETFTGRLIMTGVIAANIAIYGMIQRITTIEI